MNIRLPFNKLLIIKKPVIVFTKMPKYRVYGLTNRTEDGMYLVFLDYDNVEYSTAEKDAKAVQRKFKLGTFIIRCSSIVYKKGNGELVGNWHVIFFAKLPFKQMLNIINTTRCDEAFKKAKFQQRCKVLRLSQKGKKVSPSFYKLVADKTSFKCSSAHAHLFENIDKIAIIKYLQHLDKLGEVDLINYVTA